MSNSRAITGQLRDDKGMTLDIPKHWQVCILMTTQAYYNQTVLLKDESGNTIFQHTRGRGQGIEPVYSKVFESLECDHPTLTIHVPESGRVDCRFSEVKIENDAGEYVAVSYTFMTEDISDLDYNDLLLHITAYKKIG